MTKRFSDRQGHRPSPKPITVREDAPPALRGAVPILIRKLMGSAMARDVICEVLLVSPDPGNWSEKNIWEEVACLINEAEWYKVYDIIEALHEMIDKLSDDRAARFEQRLNDFLIEQGIGWKLHEGEIVRRGSEAFAKSTSEIPGRLEQLGFQRAASEMREALRDISRRPQPDITGAIHHAMAALEATARQVARQRNPTLGRLIPMLRLPAPLDQAVRNLWGYASEFGRHAREGQNVDPAEAELTVTVAGALCQFLAER